MVELFELAKSRGVRRRSLDSRFAASLMFSLVAGLFKRKALEPEFDVAAEAAMALGVFEALFAGALVAAARRSEMGRFLFSLVVVAALAAGGLYAQWRSGPAIRRCWRSTNGARPRGRNARPSRQGRGGSAARGRTARRDRGQGARPAASPTGCSSPAR